MFHDLKNNKKPKSVIRFFCSSLVLMLFLSGCSLGKTEAPTEAPTEVAVKPSKAIGSDNTVITKEPKFEDFQVMDEFFKDYYFDISVSNDKNLEFYQQTYSILGSYDMNGDGEDDKINALLKSNYQDGSYIEVNGNKLMLDYCNPSGEIRMIDLDSKDSYTEIAVFDDGPSADPTFMFFRYDEKEVYFVGSIDQYALMDGHGKFISSIHLTRNFYPKFYAAWIELKEEEFVTINHDVEQYIGKTVVVNGEGFFVALDKMPENYFAYTTWERDTLKEFHETQVKILDIYFSGDDRTLNWFFIELTDGERGLLYFWIGD